MFIPAAIRKKILRHLFKSGVLVVSADQAGKHQELNCLNIYAFQIGRSFADKGFAKRQYAWSHAYFTLTQEGIDWLRNYFGAPANVEPATRQERQISMIERAGPARPFRGRGMAGGNGPRGERGGFGGRGRGRRDDAAPRPEAAGQ